MRPISRIAAVVLVGAGLLTACGDDGAGTGAASPDAPAVPAAPVDTAPDTDANAEAPGGDDGNDERDACSIVSSEEIATVLRPHAERSIEVGDPEPELFECKYRIEVEDSESRSVSILPIDKGVGLAFDLTRGSFEVIERSDVGDEALRYSWDIMPGESLRARRGSVGVDVRFSGFAPEAGLTEVSLTELVELLLARL